MAENNNDIYRSHTPQAFVFVGKQQCLVESYDLTITTRGEASVCKVKIPLSNIDSSVFAEAQNDDRHVPVEIWVGYLRDLSSNKQESIQKQIERIGSMISQGRSDQQKMFVKRFDGFAGQPEWTFGDDRYLNLTCYDSSQFLREYKWDVNLKDGDTEVSRVISAIQNRISGIKIQADSYSGIRRLGEKDIESGKYTYNSSGKTYWEMLTDCADKIGKRLFIEGKTIFITSFKSKPNIWPMYYGGIDGQKVDGKQIGQYFQNLTVRYGEIGESAKSDVVVDLYSQNLTKKGKEKKTYIRYPENAAIKQNTRHIVKKVSNNMSEQELRVMAENIYKKNSGKMITGNIDIPFANNFLNIYDVVTFVSDNNIPDIKFLNNLYFCVNSIDEQYSTDGYSQKIDFDTNPDINEKTVIPKKRVAPAKAQPIPASNKLGYTPITLGVDTSILNRRLNDNVRQTTGR